MILFTHSKKHSIEIKADVLAGADLSNMDLANINFSEHDLTQTNFSGSNLTNAAFDGLSLVGVNFSEANLTSASFLGAQITDCNFKKATLQKTSMKQFEATDCSFNEADLRSVRLEKGGIQNCNFDHADLDYISAYKISFDKSSFRTKRLFDSFFSDCHIQRCDLTSARFIYARLYKNCFSDCDLSDSFVTASILKRNQFKDCSLNNALWPKNYFDLAEFHQCNLKDCDFTATISLNTIIDDCQADDDLTSRLYGNVSYLPFIDHLSSHRDNGKAVKRIVLPFVDFEDYRINQKAECYEANHANQNEFLNKETYLTAIANNFASFITNDLSTYFDTPEPFEQVMVHIESFDGEREVMSAVIDVNKLPSMAAILAKSQEVDYNFERGVEIALNLTQDSANNSNTATTKDLIQTPFVDWDYKELQALVMALMGLFSQLKSNYSHSNLHSNSYKDHWDILDDDPHALIKAIVKSYVYDYLEDWVEVNINEALTACGLPAFINYSEYE